VKQTVMDTDCVAGVEFVGLVVSQAHDSYEMFVRDAAASQQSAKVKGPFFLLCDRHMIILLTSLHSDLLCRSIACRWWRRCTPVTVEHCRWSPFRRSYGLRVY
jgi:hypothetical protein